MSVCDETEAWAQLVSTTDIDSSPIPVVKDTFVVGRSSDCDLPFVGNKLVSGKHCYLERDKDGQVWLYDTSTNGTLLNMNIKLIKGECRELKHGDEFHIVHKKNSPEDDIGYIFQDIEALRAETSSDLEEESTQEYTQPIADADSTIVDDDINEVSTSSPPTQKRKSDDSSPHVTNKKMRSQTCEDPSPEKAAAEEPLKNEKKDAKETSNDSQFGVGTAKTAEVSSTSSVPEGKSGVPQEPESDAIAESLICIICQELFHDCISLQPCMHSYCSGCYSEWMERSNECPSCRLKVDRINKNHIVNNLVEAYLKDKPEKRRSQADLDELDAKNKITRDMLYPVKNPRGCDSEDSSEDYDDEENEDRDYEEEDSSDEPVPAPVGNMLFGIGTPIFGATQIRPTTVCRQCPNFRETNPSGGTGILAGVQQVFTTIKNAVTGGGGDGAGPSTATDTGPPAAGSSSEADPDAKVMPDAPAFTCALNQNHVLCLCCMLPMPDRRAEYLRGADLPPQQCTICYRSFCHAYWGCRKADCNGCIAKLKDMNFGKKCLTSLVLDNHFESAILKDYLEAKAFSVRDVLADCLAKMVTGEYTCINQMRLTNGINTPVCYACGLMIFKDLAYSYRKDIPREQLPGRVTSRSNCYWGKNCRTQRNKPEHAQRFNHICEQTRTT
ncbi:E3 ubiquitin-protein ligase CHFR [Aplysia californica]|uniref:E3 ubiquitin-protein ligase CHFR n=1 Tax=Aplysia californica TaxID=6500 RepID=A0ABM0K1I2_APLCA|nr:E3 ubiquitin-protein ligase CHFR [Aplysia californica]